MSKRSWIDRRHRGWLVYAAGIAIATLVFLLLPAGELVQDTVYDTVALSAAVAIILGLRMNRPAHRWPWLLIAAGQATFFIGDVLWVIYAEMGVEPFPSPADVFYLAGYPFIAAGLILGIRSRLGGGDRSSLLDAAILATSVAVLSWTFQIGPLAAQLDPEPLAFAISVAYPTMDLLLIGVFIGLVAGPGVRTASFRLLGLSLLALLVADQIYAIQSTAGTYTDGGTLDVGWLVAYGTIGASALHPSMRSLFDGRPIPVTLLGPVRMAFLAAAMLTGPALLVFARHDADVGLAVIAGETAFLSVLVLARLAGLVRLLSADIAKRRVLEAQLSFQANHDPLTHLANRRLFVQRVADRLDQPARAPVAVLFLDLDDFKTVNDTLGHQAGDELLVVVGERIRTCLREGDTAARLGGDEFGVLLGDISEPGEAEAIAARMAETLSVPLSIAGTVVPVAASIGIAVHAPGMKDVDALLRAADVAMYGAKARGKDRYQVYAADEDPGDDRVGVGRVGTRRSGPDPDGAAPRGGSKPILRSEGA
jgi:diguanylate cyclase (GGDEF)-like protein